MKRPALLLGALLAAACADSADSGRPPAGTEGGPCYLDGTCGPGLHCNDDTCNAAMSQPDAAPVADAPLPIDAGAVFDARPPDAALPDAPPPVDAAPPDAAAPMFVRITVQSAVTSPAKSDRAVWDSVGSISAGDWNAYEQALSATDAYGKVLNVLATVNVSGFEKPDPFGTAELLVNDLSVDSVNLSGNSDTFTPSFSGATFTHVKWSGNVRLFVHLDDEDIALDDTIAFANVEQAHLEAALAAKAPYHANVASQTSNQLAFVTVTVTAE